MKILITGGAGFIGSALVRFIIQDTKNLVINVDKLTYAGDLSALGSVSKNPRYFFEQADICDAAEMQRVFAEYQPDIVMHLAAESHVDRSIEGPTTFIQTNILGTFILLETARAYWQTLDETRQQQFRFHHISTDEVYGDLHDSSSYFTEATAYAPSSPYSASKACSDHLVRAWYRTYGLPILITNCSNNYGPYQVPEKFLPVVILKALAGQPIPIYGNGLQIRDWLYVEDHVYALYTVMQQGVIGETYNIGGYNEKTNLEVVHLVCELLEELSISKKNQRALITKPKNIQKYADLISFIEDRPGHDRRYAIDATKIKQTLGWVPKETFETGLRKTVAWYVNHFKDVQITQSLISSREPLDEVAIS